MRYSEDHKAQTHQRILEEAARLFRRDGVAATGLQPLMKALGLTHGGFYAHFKSKDDLVEQALGQAIRQTDAATAEMATRENPLQALISGYLSEAHRNDPGAGCPLPTLCAELGQRGTPSATTDRVIRSRLEMIQNHLEGETAAQQSMLILSTLIGALLLSRSVQDPELSKELLAAPKRLLLEQLSDTRAH
ncbi:MAG: TetR/AcrR family transcriptional regulator [Pseudomonas sp.]|uniref:TetR/AcrR family transcriptional regulator n=1 Tax=Pseudomonas sp. TaxID=306 RepID=UPI00339137A3